MDKDVRNVIFKAVGLAMGVATFILSIIKQIEIENAINLLSIGLICIAIDQLEFK